MSSLSFYTPEAASLEKTIEYDEETIPFEQIWNEEQSIKCKEWIKNGRFKKVCLQFPDSYLTHSTKICDNLRNSCESVKFFILADTSYGSCCIDEIAVSHVDGDALIHFGNACLSKSTSFPVLHIFPRILFDVEDFMRKTENLPSIEENSSISVYLGMCHNYLFEKEYKEMRGTIEKKFTLENASNKFSFLNKMCENQASETKENISIFIGKDDQEFFNLMIHLPLKSWYIYNPTEKSLKKMTLLITSWLRRRYFYIEKCKDAQTLGLLVATLTGDDYLDVIKHIQVMARARGIKTYIISVGKVNPEKLANFMEIDCFVLIGCPFNNLYTSRDFYKPIVSVFECEVALNPGWKLKYPETYSTDLKDILPNGKFHIEFDANEIEESDLSLSSGKLRSCRNDENLTNSDMLMERRNYQVMETNNGTVFEDRSWRGLDPALGLSEAAKLEKGLSGIPTNYTKEVTK